MSRRSRRASRAERLGEPRRRVEEHPRDAELHPRHGGQNEAGPRDTPEARLPEPSGSGNFGRGQRTPAEQRSTATAATAGERSRVRQGRQLQEAVRRNRRADHQGHGGPRGRGQAASW